MDYDQFIESLKNSQPPTTYSNWLKALWYDANNNWEMAHQLIDDLQDETSAHLHAYLHRKEGDQANAFYWYRRAGIGVSRQSLQNEWDGLVKMILKLG